MTASTTTSQAHDIEAGWTPNNHGYPYKARCSCGWSSRGYAAKHAAEDMATWHRDQVSA